MIAKHRERKFRRFRLTPPNWIEVRRLGDTGSVNAYIINNRVAWYGKRDGIRYSTFNAAVYVSEREQPDRSELDTLPPLHKVPHAEVGEQLLPIGEGLPPPSEPALPGLEPEMPSKHRSEQVDSKNVNVNGDFND